MSKERKTSRRPKPPTHAAGEEGGDKPNKSRPPTKREEEIKVENVRAGKYRTNMVINLIEIIVLMYIAYLTRDLDL